MYILPSHVTVFCTCNLFLTGIWHVISCVSSNNILFFFCGFVNWEWWRLMTRWRLLSFNTDVYCVPVRLDDIPVRGFIGRLEEGNFIPHAHKVLFYTHHVFNIEYNEDQVNSRFEPTRSLKQWLISFVCTFVRLQALLMSLYRLSGLWPFFAYCIVSYMVAWWRNG